MSSRNDYTPEEWTMLLMAPVQAGISFLLASNSGLMGSAQEVMALYNATNKSAAQAYPNNTLIRDLLMGENQDAVREVFGKIGMSIKDAAQRRQVKPDAIDTCHKVADLLARKTTPAEAEEYKTWLMDVCTKVSNAASEGGQKVSPAEEATMKEIADALHIAPTRVR